MRKYYKKIKAFTLIELLVYIAISSIVLTLILTFSISLSEGASRVSTSQEVYHNGRFILNRLRYDLEASDGVDIGASTFGDDNGLLSINVGSGTISYFLNNGNIERQIDSDPSIILNSTAVTIDRLNFTDRTQPSGTQNFTVDIDISYKNPDGRPELNSSQNFISNILVKN